LPGQRIGNILFVDVEQKLDQRRRRQGLDAGNGGNPCGPRRYPAEDEELQAGPDEDAVQGDRLDQFAKRVGRKGRRTVDQAVFRLDHRHGDHRDRKGEAEEIEKEQQHPAGFSHT